MKTITEKSFIRPGLFWTMCVTNEPDFCDTLKVMVIKIRDFIHNSFSHISLGFYTRVTKIYSISHFFKAIPQSLLDLSYDV